MDGLPKGRECTYQYLVISTPYSLGEAAAVIRFRHVRANQSISVSGSRRSAADVEKWNKSFVGADPTDVIIWATAEFGDRICVTTSLANTLLIDMATKVAPDIKVVFVDTGFHFPETLATLRAATNRYSLNISVPRTNEPQVDPATHGHEECCRRRKVEPLIRFLLGSVDSWMSGLRRDDSPERSATPVVELDGHGLVKVNPLTVWSAGQLDEYMDHRDVIVNPLTLAGYPSIGCMPCTTSTDAANSDKRAGRWADSAKTECGIHLHSPG